jgi:hypothetical protein
MTTYVLYFFGVLGLAGTAYLAQMVDPSLAIAALLQSVLLFAAGRAMEHLKTIAQNSAYLIHLERLDPVIAAELDEERRRDEEEPDTPRRGFLGFGRRS